MKPGDVVSIYAGSVGYRKYHLCLMLADDKNAARFLFINSDSRFADTFVVPNARVSCIPENETGETCFSFSMIPRYNDKQLELFKAEIIGTIDIELAIELRAFVDSVRSLAAPDKTIVREALEAVIAALS